MSDRSSPDRPEEAVEPQHLGLGPAFFHSRDAVIVADASAGRIVLWNDVAVQVFGYTREEAVGLLVEDLVPEASKAAHRAGLAAYGRTGHGALVDSGMHVELPAMRADGASLWVDLSLTPIEADGLSGRHVMAIVRDITERKETERRLHHAHAVLERTQALASVGSWESDVTAGPGTGVFWSKEMYRIHGVDPETFRISKETVDGLIHPDDFAAWASKLTEAAASRSDLEGFAYRAVRPDGSVAWVWTEARFDPDRPQVMVGFAQDITAQKTAAQELERLALVDELTGLRNRRGFLAAAEPLLKLAHREGHDVVLLYVDLDNLKAINDSYGHRAGDGALIDTAALLRNTFRGSDLVARLGGDEFCVLMYATNPGVPIERLMAALSALPAASPAIELSAGAALRRGSESTPIEDLLSEADAAMYSAKTVKAKRAQSRGNGQPEVGGRGSGEADT